MMFSEPVELMTKLAALAKAILVASATANGMPVSPLTPLSVLAFVLELAGTMMARRAHDGGVSVFAPDVSDTLCMMPPVTLAFVAPPSE